MRLSQVGSVAWAADLGEFLSLFLLCVPKVKIGSRDNVTMQPQQQQQCNVRTIWLCACEWNPSTEISSRRRRSSTSGKLLPCLWVSSGSACWRCFQFLFIHFNFVHLGNALGTNTCRATWHLWNRRTNKTRKSKECIYCFISVWRTDWASSELIQLPTVSVKFNHLKTAKKTLFCIFPPPSHAVGRVRQQYYIFSVVCLLFRSLHIIINITMFYVIHQYYYYYCLRWHGSQLLHGVCAYQCITPLARSYIYSCVASELRSQH